MELAELKEEALSEIEDDNLPFDQLFKITTSFKTEEQPISRHSHRTSDKLRDDSDPDYDEPVPKRSPRKRGRGRGSRGGYRTSGRRPRKRRRTSLDDTGSDFEDLTANVCTQCSTVFYNAANYDEHIKSHGRWPRYRQLPQTRHQGPMGSQVERRPEAEEDEDTTVSRSFQPLSADAISGRIPDDYIEQVDSIGAKMIRGFEYPPAQAVLRALVNPNEEKTMNLNSALPPPFIRRMRDERKKAVKLLLQRIPQQVQAPIMNYPNMDHQIKLRTQVNGTPVTIMSKSPSLSASGGIVINRKPDPAELRRAAEEANALDLLSAGYYRKILPKPTSHDLFSCNSCDMQFDQQWKFAVHRMLSHLYYYPSTVAERLQVLLHQNKSFAQQIRMKTCVEKLQSLMGTDGEALREIDLKKIEDDLHLCVKPDPTLDLPRNSGTMESIKKMFEDRAKKTHPEKMDHDFSSSKLDHAFAVNQPIQSSVRDTTRKIGLKEWKPQRSLKNDRLQMGIPENYVGTSADTADSIRFDPLARIERELTQQSSCSGTANTIRCEYSPAILDEEIGPNGECNSKLVRYSAPGQKKKNYVVIKPPRFSGPNEPRQAQDRPDKSLSARAVSPTSEKLPSESTEDLNTSSSLLESLRNAELLRKKNKANLTGTYPGKTPLIRRSFPGTRRITASSFPTSLEKEPDNDISGPNSKLLNDMASQLLSVFPEPLPVKTEPSSPVKVSVKVSSNRTNSSPEEDRALPSASHSTDEVSSNFNVTKKDTNSFTISKASGNFKVHIVRKPATPAASTQPKPQVIVGPDGSAKLHLPGVAPTRPRVFPRVQPTVKKASTRWWKS